MRGTKLGAWLLVLMGLALPAVAEEVVYFTNGTSMAIRSHQVDGEMIRVDLGAGSMMAFPIVMVERVEKSGRDVFQGPTYRPANQALEGTDAGARPPRAVQDSTLDGSGSVPARYLGASVSPLRPGDDDSYTGISPGSDATRGPRSNLGPARMRRVAGPQNVRPGDPEGTYRVGDSLVLDANASSQANTKPNILSFGPREDGQGADSGSAETTDGERESSEGESSPPPESP